MRAAPKKITAARRPYLRPALPAALLFTLIVATALAALLLARSAAAAPAGTVEQVQMPAWVTRGGDTFALAPGLQLDAGDRVRTGEGARVLLRLAEGSHVKLGPNAELDLVSLAEAGEGLFEGALNVLKGAFRFTTSVLSRSFRRRLDIRIATVTAGIRGTDVWGKAAPDRDIVCLIEGEVAVSRGTDQPVTLSDPLTFYIAPKDAPPLPVGPVDPEQLARWAAETDVEDGAPVLSADGEWTVYLQSLATVATAERARDALIAQGYPARVIEARVHGEVRHRVAVTGLASFAAARAFTERAASELGLPGGWMERQ
ncbi:MAG: FecR domain-containing protein [Gammaproteobacteria bacterium]|nr:FecR domain-containing protein [Gammaproteobacteria bacterium]